MSAAMTINARWFPWNTQVRFRTICLHSADLCGLVFFESPIERKLNSVKPRAVGVRNSLRFYFPVNRVMSPQW